MAASTLSGGTAPGYRNRDTGDLGTIGDGGYNWSSTSYGSGDHYRGVCLDFRATVLGPRNAALRASGLQLRCLSE
ncbi:hypothetical protein [uncultured Rikenella sp.]|nr:hypothetical protein [uncultured Rikenella sp.]